MRFAIKLTSDFPPLHEDLGSVLALQEKFEAAVPCFERAVQLDPGMPLAHKKLGQALAALGRGQEADEAFENYFEKDPDKPAGFTRFWASARAYFSDKRIPYFFLFRCSGNFIRDGFAADCAHRHIFQRF